MRRHDSHTKKDQGLRRGMQHLEEGGFLVRIRVTSKVKGCEGKGKR
jgi:hypothetical protein